MDCHLANTTTWTLMGVYMEAAYFGNDAFFEQLFKHEGVCLWNDDELYEFMSETRESSFPQGCVETGVQNDWGDYLYIDLKPAPSGNMALGLYLDDACKEEYIGGYTLVDNIAASLGLIYGNDLDSWNKALEVYKVCQPCRAYNLNDNEGGNAYYYDNEGCYQEDVNGGYFQCEDDAGYTNVNQCMKFRTHAELEAASWEDLVTATNQGGLLQLNISGTIFGSERESYQQVLYDQKMKYEEMAVDEEARLAAQAKMKKANGSIAQGGFIFVAGLATFSFVCYMIYKAHFKDDGKSSDMKEPLVSEPSKKGVMT